MTVWFWLLFVYALFMSYRAWSLSGENVALHAALERALTNLHHLRVEATVVQPPLGPQPPPPRSLHAPVEGRASQGRGSKPEAKSESPES